MSYQPSGSNGERARGAFDYCSKLRCRGFDDDGVEPELGGEDGQWGGVRGVQFEAQELTTAGRVRRRMPGVSTPLNKEGQEAIGVIFESQRLPVEFFAVGAFAGTGNGAVGVDTVLFEFGGEGFDVVAEVSGPTYQARLGELFQLVEQRRDTGGLFRIRRDDFEIATEALRACGTEREESVLCAAA